MIYTIGIEGGMSSPACWGTPVLRDDDGVFNPVSGHRVSWDSYLELVAEGHVSKFDPIPSPDIHQVHLVLDEAVANDVIPRLWPEYSVSRPEITFARPRCHVSFPSMSAFNDVVDCALFPYTLSRILALGASPQREALVEVLQILTAGRPEYAFPPRERG